MNTILGAFLLTMVKILAFTISKQYFYNFNTLFYNIPNIKTSNFFTTSFKYYFFIIFYSFFVFIFFILSLWSHCLSLSLSISLSLPLSFSVSLSQPSNHTHHWPLATTIPTTTTTIRDLRWWDPCRSSWWPTLMRSIKSMIHAGHVNDPRTQTHELRPTNLDPKNRQSTSLKHIKPQPTTIVEAQSSAEHRERREKKEVREERER